jgi:hypothetical protein
VRRCREAQDCTPAPSSRSSSPGAPIRARTRSVSVTPTSNRMCAGCRRPATTWLSLLREAAVDRAARERGSSAAAPPVWTRIGRSSTAFALNPAAIAEESDLDLEYDLARLVSPEGAEESEQGEIFGTTEGSRRGMSSSGAIPAAIQPERAQPDGAADRKRSWPLRPRPPLRSRPAMRTPARVIRLSNVHRLTAGPESGRCWSRSAGCWSRGRRKRPRP